MSLWCRTLSWHNALALASAASSGKTTSRALGVFLYVSVMKRALVIIFTTTLAYAADVPITQDELVRRTQELYDAVVCSSDLPWKKYFADDCIFSDEKGRTLDKTKLVADITPVPAGYSGSIKVDKVQSRIVGGTAVLSYDANETETIFGQNLTARYHITDTWLRRDGEWQIIASQAHRYYEDPAIGKIDPKSSVTSSAPTSSRPIKHDRLQPKATNYSSNAKAKRNDCFPKLPISFSASASKAGSSFVTTPTARSTLSSTAETTKTLSGAKRNKLSALIPHDHRT